MAGCSTATSDRAAVARIGERNSSSACLRAFNDMGYIRRLNDKTMHGGNNADPRLARRALPARVPPALAWRTSRQSRADHPLHGSERRSPRSREDPIFKLVGPARLADIIAQMSARCYLEKCRDALSRFAPAASRASRPRRGGVIFSSPRTAAQTPNSTPGSQRLDKDLGGATSSRGATSRHQP